jgi:hypothetical protein
MDQTNEEISSEDLDFFFSRPILSAYVREIFEADAAVNGGVLRRRVVDVDAHAAREELEMEVKRRNFHLLRSGDHYVILCVSEPIEVLC